VAPPTSVRAARSAPAEFTGRPAARSGAPTGGAAGCERLLCAGRPHSSRTWAQAAQLRPEGRPNSMALAQVGRSSDVNHRPDMEIRRSAVRED